MCSVPDCQSPTIARGFCSRHWFRWKRHGDPLGGRVPNGASLDWVENHLSHEGDDCLIWPFARTSTGYGILRYEGRMQLASKVVCEKVHGRRPPAFEAAHSCGNGRGGCVSPDHLRWLSRSDNNLEKRLHGTMIQGEAVHNAKLSEDAVREIRAQLQDGQQIVTIAKTFQVHRVTIAHIRDGKSWAWVKDNSEFERRKS